MHAQEFADRTSSTYSILDGEMVIGCVYVYPGQEQPVGDGLDRLAGSERVARRTLAISHGLLRYPHLIPISRNV